MAVLDPKEKGGEQLEAQTPHPASGEYGRRGHFQGSAGYHVLSRPVANKTANTAIDLCDRRGFPAGRVPYSEETDMSVQLVEAPFFDRRGEDRVIIFPSRPYWFAASAEIEAVLGCFALSDELQIVAAIQQAIDVDEEEARATFEELRELLYSRGVLLIDGEPASGIVDYAPTNQVNDVENVLVIAATQECNLRCGMCYARAAKALPNEMTTVEIVGILDQLSAMAWGESMSRVALTGGEFFTRVDAFELIEAVHSRGYFVQLNTTPPC